MKILIAITVIWVVLVGILAYFVATAPKGHEDDDGFHYDE